MTCDQVGIINNPYGVLENKACTIFHRQALIGASQRPLLLREDKKDKGQTPFPTSHTGGAIWSEPSYLMPSSTFPGLGSSQIEPILPPHPPFDIEGDPLPYHLLNRAALLICIAFHQRASLPL